VHVKKLSKTDDPWAFLWIFPKRRHLSDLEEVLLLITVRMMVRQGSMYVCSVGDYVAGYYARSSGAASQQVYCVPHLCRLLGARR
jgi:hypothetical protein